MGESYTGIAFYYGPQTHTMQTQLFVENYPVDLTNDISTLLTLAIDDIRKIDARDTTVSKTIVLPGTANNNKLFGHIFQVGQANDYDAAQPNVGYNFNAAKSASAIIFQDNLQSFKGVLRLLQINLDKGHYEYEVAVFGEIALLNVKLSSGLLEDLDFSTYDQAYTFANIIASWDNPGGTGIYYPLIDYGTYSTNKHDWDIRTLRPALYAKEYIDKMFSDAGFRYECAMFNTTRFKKIVIPHSQKKITRKSANYLDVNITPPLTFTQANGYNTPILFPFPNATTLGQFTPNGAFTEYTYTGTDIFSAFVILDFAVTYTKTVPETYLQLQLYLNNTSTLISPGAFTFFGGSFVPGGGNLSGTQTGLVLAYVALNPGDKIIAGFTYANTFGNYSATFSKANLYVTNFTTIYVPVQPGETIKVSDTIPKNIRQIDFFTSIIKLFNLYVYEDRFDKHLIHISPYIDFYSTNSANAVDWTYKLNRNKPIKIKPMSELNAKVYEFRFKSDSDYYNDLYKKRYGVGYGDYVFDSQYEFAEQKQTVELVFSATPMVGYQGQEKVYSTIMKRTGTDTAPVEETTDSNIRILQTKKVTGVLSWSIKNGTTILTTTTNYGYAGHLDDPDAPDNDINFGALNELFFSVPGGNLTKTQFNIFWSGLMAEITDKDSKLVDAFFYLTVKDIISLDFSKFVYLDGIVHRLKKIDNYNMTRPEDCRVELLRVNNLIY